MFHLFERLLDDVFVPASVAFEDSSVDLRRPSTRQPISSRGTLLRMQARPLVGRQNELSVLVGAVESAGHRQGSLWFVSGEPGIGKSRLAEELARRARDTGALVVWGRCWEAGGAPAYWPWIQALRALLRDEDPSRLQRALGQRARHLGHLLPELFAHGDDRDVHSVDADRERFELLDAVSGVLCDVTRERPILLIFEDLHMADASSLSVFEVLGPQLKSSSVCVVGTLRDADARLAESRDSLMAVLAQGRMLTLDRLGRRDVESFLRECLGHAPGREVRDAIYRATEGNPLFLTEVTRLLTTTSQWERLGTSGVAIPGNIRHTLRRRLETLSEPTLEGARVASVLGREFSGSLLAALWGRSVAGIAEMLNEAMDAGVLIEASPGEYRFSHVLLREVLHQDLLDEQRTRLHLEAAELLEHRKGDAALWSEIAHHHLEAGSPDRSRAVQACRRAATQAHTQLAFFDARKWYSRALTALGRDDSVDLAERAELLLQLADAELHSGALERGKKTCEQAAELARDLAQPELLAHAALTYGSVLVFAAIDQRLVQLLSEALDALQAEESALKATLTARLAAALQPAQDPEVPIAMARDAVAMARRLSDETTWLEVARYAVSAMMDLGRPSERAALNREYIRVAERLHRPLEVLRGQMRLVFDSFELGDLLGAEATVSAINVQAEALGHPFFAWRAKAFSAMCATYKGEFEQAEQHIEAARTLGERARDPNAARATVMQRFVMLRLLGRHAEALELSSEVVRTHQGLELADLLARLHLGAVRLSEGLEADHALFIADEEIETIFSLGDISMLAPLVELARARSDVALARRVKEVLETKEARFVSGGMLSMTWMEPTALVRARCAVVLGDLDDAERQFRAAIAAAEGTQSRPFAAWARLEYGELLVRSAAPGAARQPLEESLRIARELDMAAVRKRAEHALEQLSARGGETKAEPAGPARAAPSAVPRLERDGESWKLSVGGKDLRLRDTKGVQWLHELMARPGESVHVLELVAPQGTPDQGDAGEHLDRQAVSEYRKRLAEVTHELEEAEAFRDSGRVEAAQTELDFLRRELSRALGLGSRARRAGTAQERARINVQRRIRDAIRRIGSLDEDAGRHFERAVSTGLYCTYRP